MSPTRRRRAVEHLQRVFGVSQRWACRLVGQHRSTQRDQPMESDRDRVLCQQLRRFSRVHPRWGYRRAHAVLCEQGWRVNRKAVQRLWREEGLRVPVRRRKRERLEAQVLVGDWRIEYNTLRPHSALGYLTPTDSAKAWTTTHPELPQPMDQQPGSPQSHGGRRCGGTGGGCAKWRQEPPVRRSLPTTPQGRPCGRHDRCTGWLARQL